MHPDEKLSPGMRAPHLKEGARAEGLALRYLIAQGLRPLAQNVRYRFGELDLVMWHRETLVFVEVRSRRRGEWGCAAESVTLAKRLRLRRAAAAYLAARPGKVPPCRFDVISIDDGDLRWWQDAFQAG